jgi:hypothetical protein
MRNEIQDVITASDAILPYFTWGALNSKNLAKNPSPNLILGKNLIGVPSGPFNAGTGSGSNVAGVFTDYNYLLTFLPD